MCMVLVWVFLHAEKLLYIPIYRECGSLHFLVDRQESICGNFGNKILLYFGLFDQNVLGENKCSRKHLCWKTSA